MKRYSTFPRVSQYNPLSTFSFSYYRPLQPYKIDHVKIKQFGKKKEKKKKEKEKFISITVTCKY